MLIAIDTWPTVPASQYKRRGGDNKPARARPGVQVFERLQERVVVALTDSGLLRLNALLSLHAWLSRDSVRPCQVQAS